MYPLWSAAVCRGFGSKIGLFVRGFKVWRKQLCRLNGPQDVLMAFASSLRRSRARHFLLLGLGQLLLRPNWAITVETACG
jgi:hypothetical protein